MKEGKNILQIQRPFGNSVSNSNTLDYYLLPVSSSEARIRCMDKN